MEEDRFNRFNEAMAEFERQIESLPEDRRPALRTLAEETRRRGAEIREAGDAGRVAAKELVDAIARLSDASARLLERATDLDLLVKYARFDAEARERELRGEGRDHDG